MQRLSSPVLWLIFGTVPIPAVFGFGFFMFWFIRFDFIFYTFITLAGFVGYAWLSIEAKSWTDFWSGVAGSLLGAISAVLIVALPFGDDAYWELAAFIFAIYGVAYGALAGASTSYCLRRYRKLRASKH